MTLTHLWFNAKKVVKALVKARDPLHLARTIRVIKRSELFDAKWYLTNNPDVASAKMDPALHYFLFGVKSGRNPSSYFVNDEYYALHNDVKKSQMNPLYHYEVYGKKEGREISFLEQRSPEFPEGVIADSRFNSHFERNHGRTAIVASYFSGGVIPESLIYLLKGIREVADNIVIIGDCLVMPGELDRLSGLVTIAKFERHEQYDFGSYRRGYELAKSNGLLSSEIADELIICNDSNFGPVYPLSEMFSAMKSREDDFWGITGYDFFGIKHVSSYFYVMRRTIIDDPTLETFLDGVKGILPRDQVIVRYELKLTKALEDQGFKYSTYVPFGVVKGSPAKYPVTMLKKFRDPMIKVKVVNGDSYENVKTALSIISKVNPELRKLIKPKSLKREHKLISYAEHQASFPDKIKLIAAKVKAGGKVKAVFFVSSASMFPAKPLFEKMLEDRRFDPYLAVIPDNRWKDGHTIEEMEACEKELSSWCPAESMIHIRPDEFDVWLDVLKDADIVCYPSPYELSHFRYNPHYAVGRNFLPICVNYGYYRSIYDRTVMAGQSYAYMWKAFFECEATAEEYRKYSAIGGTNVDISGYIKMDAYAKVKIEPHSRKRILVALHHSVEGGANKKLSLANFIEYADFFMALPDKYPEMDFVFRPHPFLFKILVNRKIWNEQKVNEYIKAIRAKTNVIWSEGGDYFKEFAESDGCIQDCGSYLVEYMYTQKPCCYMLKSPKDIDSKFAPLGKACLEQCYLAYSTEEIEGFVRNVILGKNDPKATSRQSFAKEIMVNYPNAAGAALESIKIALGIKYP